MAVCDGSFGPGSFTGVVTGGGGACFSVAEATSGSGAPGSDAANAWLATELIINRADRLTILISLILPVLAPALRRLGARRTNVNSPRLRMTARPQSEVRSSGPLTLHEPMLCPLPYWRSGAWHQLLSNVQPGTLVIY